MVDRPTVKPLLFCLCAFPILSPAQTVTFSRIPAGSFQMGESAPVTDALLTPLTYPRRDEMPGLHVLPFQAARRGDFDEHPVHTVKISKPFFLSTHEITNAQYEQFDPAHKALRAKHGFSHADNEAVVFVSWHDAVAFCRWLSRKEGKPYRLPTEAEWEYAARAGSTTLFHTGDTLPAAFLKNARSTEFNSPADRVPLTVGLTPPNKFGLYDMHGNVEEWTADWYGPYPSAPQTDPTGRAAGDFRVTRGGSHGTDPYYLRSANRLGSLPDTRHWLIGFRIVQGSAPQTKPLPALQPVTTKNKPAPPYNTAKPFFQGPREYVKIPSNSHGPIYSWHNHDTAIAECPNGDLLAIWYTCQQERGRELAVASARLRRGETEWDPAQPFWDAPDRNDHCPALWFDGENTLYHFNGLGVAGRWEPLAIVMRTSTDNGHTWSQARLIAPEFGYRNMVGHPVFKTASGAIVFGADAAGGSTIWVSRDNGETWADAGGNIRGVHAAIAETKGGQLLAIGRGQNIGGFSPQSISTDLGKTWQSTASPIPPISGGQRHTLIRLREGPLFLASFAEGDNPNPRRPLTNLYGALSFDDGKTWPIRRVITDGKPEHGAFTIDGGWFRMSPSRSEPQGYLSATQSRDGVIHLISSWNHYAFNLAWLREPAPQTADLQPKNLPAKTLTANPTGEINPRQGATFELTTGDFELSLRTGPLTANRYRLRIDQSGVSYWRAGKYERIAPPGPVRIAIRPDTAAQIYVASKLVSTEDAEIAIDWRQPARGTYWRGAQRADLSGPFQP